MDTIALEKILGESVRNTVSLGGGCIANTQKITTASDRQLVVKQSGQSNDMFIKEANGLKELARAATVKVPEIFYADEKCLLIEYIEEGGRSAGFFTSFGIAMAGLHRFSSEQFGFFEDNYIGATPQLNIPEGSEANNWSDFYFNKRLLYQFKLAEKNGYVNQEFRQLFKNLETMIPRIMEGSEEPPALLHGDLWGGNFMVNKTGEAVIIDPAVYYGHREAELAMTKLFGGFNEEFYQAYHEKWPLKPGHEYRQGIYTLYHVLNHLNLFGSGYLHQSMTLMRQYQD